MRIVYALIFFALLQSDMAYSQKKDNNNKKLSTVDYLGTNYTAQYNLAIQVKDYNSACSALYGLLAINENDTNTLNSLLTIYFQLGQTEQCFILSKHYLSKFRDNTTILDYCGKSAELLNRYADALECYQKLYIITKHLYYGYQVVSTEYALGRRMECVQHVDELLMDPYVATDRLTLYLDTSSSSKNEEVSIKAALFNLKGNAYADLREYAKARELYIEALKLEPQFEIARTGFNKIKNK